MFIIKEKLLTGYGRVSLCIRRCVESVLDRLNAFPHCLHSKTFSTLCTALVKQLLLKVVNLLKLITYADSG